jgi:uncharacterized protein (UPF0147 family)
MNSEIVENLNLLLSEEDLPKSIRDKIGETITILTEKRVDNIAVNRALQDLCDAAENTSLAAHHRMQLFNVVSLLETV